MLKYLACFLILTLPAVVSARWIEDITLIENSAVGAVSFSHYQHLEAVGNNCVLCHNQLFQIDTSKNAPVSMTDMQQGKSCGGCHNGNTAFSVNGDCGSCHPTRDISFKVAEGDALFSHEIHSGIYSCSDCHPDLFIPETGRNSSVSMEQMAAGKSCGACHDGNTAFSSQENCESCHDM
jgi:c(7)-type cytochrome triheme protein